MRKLFMCVCLGMSVSFLYAQNVKTNKLSVSFSAIKGTASKPDTIIISSVKGTARISELKITGPNASYFKITSPKLTQVVSGKDEKIAIVFEPAVDFIGIARATLPLKSPAISIELVGLSTKGIEGENEATLADVVDALGYKINVGWTTLANHLKPELQGEELPPSLFKKAAGGNVEMIPVARYSPDFALNFGYYKNLSYGPRQYQTGILSKAGKFPEHQILYPGLASGSTSFDPGESTFGFYAISPTHTVYSEDIWNMLFYPTHAAHAARIYPVKDKAGKTLENTYLLCLEEAANGDYNDYVFLVKNIKPVSLQTSFSELMSEKLSDNWYSFLQIRGKDSDPGNIFTMEANKILHDTGKELGYIMSRKSYGNFHFVLEFKWGEKRWPPRESNKRDSGICYNIPEDTEDKVWPPSVECQIQEGDVGDFWLLGFSTIEVDGKQNQPLLHSNVVKKKDAEKPYGEWNTVEVISFNGKCVHIVNGVVVAYGENSSLIGGKILLQSEYAEIYYKNVKIREL